MGPRFRGDDERVGTSVVPANVDEPILTIA